MSSPDPNGPELWAPVPTFPMYEASSHGRIRNAISGRVLRPFKGYGKDGRFYLKVCLYRRGERYCQFVHRLVAFSFFEIDHRNRRRNRNEIWNLEPVLRRENDARWRVAEDVPF